VKVAAGAVGCTDSPASTEVNEAEMQWYLLALGSLGVWRLSHLLNVEDGPLQSIARLRAATAGGFWSKLFDCFHCLSLWVAIPFALGLGTGWGTKLLLWPALSGAAILIERLTGTMAPASYIEDEQPSRE
jgi:hypothetical protein